jgi:hypothetical protein
LLAADGAFMEPRGCNRWQSAANRPAAKTAETSENRCRRLRPLPEKFHGKQGVCRGLPPVAGGPLPEKEEVDLYARRAAISYRCSPDRGSGRSRTRYKPDASRSDCIRRRAPITNERATTGQARPFDVEHQSTHSTL